MSDDKNVLETSDDGQFRLRLVLDQYPDPPYDDTQSPLLRLDSLRTTHVDGSSRPRDDDTAIEEAAKRWGLPSRDGFERYFVRYLRAFFGVTQVETWWSGSYWYVTYDSAAWRDFVGAPPGSADMDEYKAYCEGDVWGWLIEKQVTWTADDGVTQRTSWEDADSCWGYYGSEYAEEEARERWADFLACEKEKEVTAP